MILAPKHETLAQFKRRVVRGFIIRKLRENNWNVKRTAEEIDTPRSNLYKMLESYGVKRKE